jgi:hypothetical protein
MKIIPTWDFVGEKLAKDGVKPPRRWPGGFCQELPADESLTLTTRKEGRRLYIQTAVGGNNTGATFPA